jgi:hypothetical protein
MADAIAFPAWFGPKDGEPIQVRHALEIQEGWVQHFGHYDVQRGCWVPREQPKPEKAAEEPKAPAPAATGLGELRKQYKAKFGKNPSPRLSADAIREKLAT